VASKHYMIRGGREGSDRLKVLDRVTWPTSEPFLRKAGLCEGMRCLDAGCGNGETTLRLLSILGPSGAVTGLDFDAEVIGIAQAAAQKTARNAHFDVWDIQSDPLPKTGAYDFAYARFLLSHLTDPQRAIQTLLQALRPGGVLAIEDVDFRGHFSYPACRAFDRYVELYEATGRRRGTDPLIGPRLHGMLVDAGLKEVGLNVVSPTFCDGEGKRMALLTLKNIRGSVSDAGLASKAEIAQTVDELETFTKDPRSIMSLPRLFQVWGAK